MFLDKVREAGCTLEEHTVSAHVLLGDSTTRKEISKAVTVHLKFSGPQTGKDHEAEIYCYVLPSPDTTQLIIGVP